MAYLVLARKYRPQSFSDLTGQEHVVRTLANAFKAGRVAHALLFCGPRGCGKTTTARIVARALNCEKGPTAEPCGECTACREITAGTDVDVQEIDAASNTGVDNVRELRESAKYLPARDRFKIFIVDEVHMLSKAAFNAFLKTLEEPPGHVKFIFATTDPRALPETILSRCQRHNFRLVPLKLIAARLREIARAEGVELDEGALSLVSRQAAGSMRDALSVMDQLISSVPSPIDENAAAAALGALDRGVIADLAGALLARDARGVLQAVARAHEGGHDVRRMAEDLAAHLRNLVAVGLDGGALDLPDHEVQALSRQAAGVEPAELTRLFDLISGSLFEISRAAQPRHALEVALLKAIYLAPAVAVQTLLARVEDLAQRLGGGGAGSAGSTGGGTRGDTAAGRPSPAWRGPAGSPRTQTRATAEDAPAAPPGVPAVPAVPATAAAPAPPAPAPHPQPSFAPPAPRPQPSFVAPTPAAPVPAPPAVAARPAGPRPAPASKPWERHLAADSSSTAPDAAAERRPEPPAPPPMRAADAPPVRGESPEAAAVTSMAPAAPPVPIAADLAADPALAARWPSMVEAVRAARKRLASVLEHAHPLAFEGGELSLGFLQAEMHARTVREEQPALEELLSRFAGLPVRVRVVDLRPGDGTPAPSLAEQKEREVSAAREARLRLGREHPAVQRAAALLGAEIEDVRDLAGEAT